MEGLIVTTVCSQEEFQSREQNVHLCVRFIVGGRRRRVLETMMAESVRACCLASSTGSDARRKVFGLVAG